MQESYRIECHKGTLLGMAIRGESKPREGNPLLGRLRAFMSPTSRYYDPEFKEEIIKIAGTKWFKILSKDTKKE
jgi:hypothetical protein